MRTPIIASILLAVGCTVEDEGMFVSVDNDSPHAISDVRVQFEGGSLSFGRLGGDHLPWEFVVYKRVDPIGTGSSLVLTYEDHEGQLCSSEHTLTYDPGDVGEISAVVKGGGTVSWSGTFQSP